MSVTDHLIRRRPDSGPKGPLVERHDGNTTAYRGEVVAYYTPADPLYLAVAQVRHRANLDQGLRQLEAALATGARSAANSTSTWARRIAMPANRTRPSRHTGKRVPDFRDGVIFTHWVRHCPPPANGIRLWTR